eukprot:3699045-Prymnesium_polylepis.1
MHTQHKDKGALSHSRTIVPERGRGTKRHPPIHLTRRQKTVWTLSARPTPRSIGRTWSNKTADDKYKEADQVDDTKEADQGAAARVVSDVGDTRACKKKKRRSARCAGVCPRAHMPTGPQAHRPTGPQAHRPTGPHAHIPTCACRGWAAG